MFQFLNWSQLSVQIFPNPAGDYINVISSAAIAKISIADVTGRVLIQVENNSTTQLDISKLSTRVYFLNLQMENGELTSYKIIKQ